METDVRWQWCRFAELTIDTLYAVIAAREAVFVVEQNCPYLDCDGKDVDSWHLIGWLKKDGQEVIAAYLRVVDPGKKFKEVSIGRVITTVEARGLGLGRELLKEGVTRSDSVFPGEPIRISAQHRLERFYQEAGFIRVSDPYDEDGIPHIEMLRAGVGTH